VTTLSFPESAGFAPVIEIVQILHHKQSQTNFTHKHCSAPYKVRWPNFRDNNIRTRQCCLQTVICRLMSSVCVRSGWPQSVGQYFVGPTCARNYVFGKTDLGWWSKRVMFIFAYSLSRTLYVICRDQCSDTSSGSRPNRAGLVVEGGESG